MDIKSIKKDIIFLSLIFGFLFAISGIVEILIGVCSILGVRINLFLFTGDVLGGLALLAVGITYFLGVKKAIDEDIRAVSYLFTASVVGLGIGIIAFLLLISNAVGFLLGFEDWQGWSVFNDITVYLILGLFAVIPYKVVKMLYLFYKLSSNISSSVKPSNSIIVFSLSVIIFKHFSTVSLIFMFSTTGIPFFFAVSTM